MDLWQLNIFCKVIELKSFSRAGEAVNITQPTISSHIKDIEDTFGCRLIDRLPKEAVPTKAGEILYSYARRIISLHNEAQSAISQYLGKIKGELYIGGSTIPGTYILPKVIGAFKEKYPEVNISIKIGDTEDIKNELLSGDIELAVVGAKTKDANIVHSKLINDEMRLVIPSGHKWVNQKTITLKMLLEEPFISRERGSGTLRSINKILKQIKMSVNNLNVVAQMGSTEAVKQGIKSGIGVSILSDIAVTDDIKAGALKAIGIEGLNLDRNFFLIKHKLRSPSPLSIYFENFLKEEFGLLYKK